MTVENVSGVLKHCQPRQIVQYLLPEVQQKKEYCNLEEVFLNGASYYILYHPQASWSDLATTLYWHGVDLSFYEKRVKPYLPMKGACVYD